MKIMVENEVNNESIIYGDAPTTSTRLTLVGWSDYPNGLLRWKEDENLPEVQEAKTYYAVYGTQNQYTINWYANSPQVSTNGKFADSTTVKTYYTEWHAPGIVNKIEDKPGLSPNIISEGPPVQTESNPGYPANSECQAIVIGDPAKALFGWAADEHAVIYPNAKIQFPMYVAASINFYAMWRAEFHWKTPTKPSTDIVGNTTNQKAYGHVNWSDVVLSATSNTTDVGKRTDTLCGNDIPYFTSRMALVNIQDSNAVPKYQFEAWMAKSSNSLFYWFYPGTDTSSDVWKSSGSYTGTKTTLSSAPIATKDLYFYAYCVTAPITVRWYVWKQSTTPSTIIPSGKIDNYTDETYAYQDEVDQPSGAGTISTVFTNAGVTAADGTTGYKQYSIIGWTTSATSTTPTLVNFVLDIEQNTTYYAVWKKRSLQCTWNKNSGSWPDGTTSNTKTTTIYYGATPSAPATPTRTNYTLLGWNTSSTATTASTLSAWQPTFQIYHSSSADTRTYYAIWSQVDSATFYRVGTYYGGECGTSTTNRITDSGFTWADGTTSASKTAPISTGPGNVTKSSFIFGGYYTATSPTAYRLSSFTKNATYYAAWYREYTVIFYLYSSTSGGASPIYFNCADSACTIQAYNSDSLQNRLPSSQPLTTETKYWNGTSPGQPWTQTVTPPTATATGWGNTIKYQGTSGTTSRTGWIKCTFRKYLHLQSSSSNTTAYIFLCIPASTTSSFSEGRRLHKILSFVPDVSNCGTDGTYTKTFGGVNGINILVGSGTSTNTTQYITSNDIFTSSYS